MYDTQKTCNNCIYFIQHYVKVDKEFCKAFCGHCNCLIDKQRTSFIVKKAQSCQNFTPRRQ